MYEQTGPGEDPVEMSEGTTNKITFVRVTVTKYITCVLSTVGLRISNYLYFNYYSTGHRHKYCTIQTLSQPSPNGPMDSLQNKILLTNRRKSQIKTKSHWQYCHCSCDDVWRNKIRAGSRKSFSERRGDYSATTPH